MKASVVIPVRNGGEKFRQCLHAVLSQKFAHPFECVVVDTDSSDGSWEFLQSQTEGPVPVRLQRIQTREFGHGRTRNLGASLAQGEFIAFLTQDAVPANENWLANLVTAAESVADSAGAFGRHLAWPEHGPLMRIGMQAHFRNFGESVTAYRLEDRARYDSDPGYRQHLHFFSDNNSLLRRSVWEQHPYPDVSFGEDQLWAKSVIEAGYAKVYCPDAVVYHSHRYGLRESIVRAREEALFYFDAFGYKLGSPLRQALRGTWHKAKADWASLRTQAPAENSITERLLILRDSLALHLGHRAARKHLIRSGQWKP